MFFCIRDVSDGRPVGINIKGREPLAYKVKNQKIFRNAINELFEDIDKGLFKSDPISWNLYRQINGIPLDYNGYGNDIFRTKGDYIVIDDYTTDIDFMKDIPKLEKLIKIVKGGIDMFKVEVIKDFHLGRFNELQNIVRKSKNADGYLYIGDVFECTEDIAEYLMKTNSMGQAFVKVIEIIPAKTEEKEKIEDEKKTVRRRTRRKTIAKED